MIHVRPAIVCLCLYIIRILTGLQWASTVAWNILKLLLPPPPPRWRVHQNLVMSWSGAELNLLYLLKRKAVKLIDPWDSDFVLRFDDIESFWPGFGVSELRALREVWMWGASRAHLNQGCNGQIHLLYQIVEPSCRVSKHWLVFEENVRMAMKGITRMLRSLVCWCVCVFPVHLLSSKSYFPNLASIPTADVQPQRYSWNCNILQPHSRFCHAEHSQPQAWQIL